MVNHSVFVTHPIGALSLNDSAKIQGFFWNHQILGGDKGRFSAAFNLKLR